MSNDFDNDVYHDINYGSGNYNKGDLYIPKKVIRGILCLLHGGFWKMPYDKSQFSNISLRFASLGFVVWNIEYRRIECEGAGYPGTFIDTLNAYKYIFEIIRKYDLSENLPITLAGHSAGGQLALWIEENLDEISIHPNLIIGLAPIVDLEICLQDDRRKDFILNFLRYSPDEDKSIYINTSPKYFKNIFIPKIVIHGIEDEVVPIIESEMYVEKVRLLGGEIQMIKVKDGRHMDFLDENSSSIKILEDILLKKFA